MGASRVHGDLIDVRVVVDDAQQQVGDDVVRGIGGDPCSTILLIGEQRGDARRIVIGDGCHADSPKTLAGGALEIA